MGVFDFFRREGGPQSRQTDQGADDGKTTIRIAPKPGTLYYLRARNVKSGFDDILVFDSETMRRRYIGTARESTPTPGGWYFSEWETSAEERLQEELENQRKALTDSYTKQITQLEYKIRGLQSDCRNLQTKTAGGTWQEKYNNELHANSIIKRELQAERQKNAELLALIQQAKERKQAEQKPPVQTKSAADILNALQADIYKVMATHDNTILDRYAAEYQRELQQIKKKMPLQGRIVLAMIARKVNSI